jgi:hypothetical protein
MATWKKQAALFISRSKQMRDARFEKMTYPQINEKQDRLPTFC